MASQLFKRAFAANQPTCHYFKISHPSTVVLTGLRGEASPVCAPARRRRERRPRRLKRSRVFYLSAQIAARFCPTSQAFYDRKRAEGESHKQAILALARRRLDVLWALIRDQRTFEVLPPQRGLAVG
jgi:hypothetical protein